MLIFAAAPLVALGSLSRTRFVAIRGRLMSAGRYGRHAFGQKTAWGRTSLGRNFYGLPQEAGE